MTDCTVIGGGPVGLVFAALNHSKKNKIQLFEAKESGASHQDTRALALSNGTRLIMERIGVWEDLKKNLININKIHTSQANTFGRTLLDAKDFNETSLGYIISYGDLMKSLTKKVQSLSDVKIFYETKVSKCIDDRGLLNLSVQTKNQSRDIKTKFVILADGANKKIKGIELNQTTKNLNHSAIVTKLTAELPHQNTAYERFTPEGPIALLPNKSNKFSLVWTGSCEYIDRLKEMNDKRFLSKLHKSFGDRVGNFESCEKRISFNLIQSRSEVFHSNIVALGNASQTMHPVAGQGLNTGFKDAFELDKLLKKFIDKKNLGLVLDNYKVSRSKQQKKILDFTELLVDGFLNDLIGLRNLRGYALTLLDISKPMKKSFVRKLSYGE